MNEEITGEALVGYGLTSKLAYDVVGPTAKYLGKEGAHLAEVGVTGIKSVFVKAHYYLSKRGEVQGGIAPRVLKNVLDQACLCEDELQATYLGGMLASSKNGYSRDDRAVSLLTLLNGLSTYQIRTHAILYTSLLNFKWEKPVELWKYVVTNMITVRIGETDYLTAMDYAEGEFKPSITSHCFIGLQQRGLSENGHILVETGSKPPYRYFYPTPLGIELFMWGIGCGHLEIGDFSAALIDRLGFAFDIQPLEIRLERMSYG